MKKRHFELLLHILAWLCIAHWLETNVAKHKMFINGIKNVGFYVSTNRDLWLWYALVSVFKAAFFYGNVYWLFPKFLQHQSANYLKPIALNMVGCMLAEFLFVVLVYFILGPSEHESNYLQFSFNFLTGQFIPYTTILMFSYGYWAAWQWVLNQNDLKRMGKTNAELALLKTQLNPHFLFNTLNNLFSMAIEKRAGELAESIAKLTEMMRYTLYESNEEYVPLTREVEFIENYVKLQRLRFTEEEVPVHFNVRGELHTIQVCPMLLINFVENAFKHGISLKKTSFIDMDLEVTTSRICFVVLNTDHHKPGQAAIKEQGFGLHNTRKLLDLKYPDRYTLDIKEEDELFKITLVIRLKKQKLEIIA